MDNKDDKRTQLIRAMLARPGGADAAERQLLPWRSLALHLSPLIGESGFNALYARTGRLLAPQHRWLTNGPSSQTLDALFRTLAEDLARAEPAQAAQANEALLTTFTRLLTELIGEGLTTRLIDSAWNGVQAPNNAGEQK
ncbi:hypothetical protein [Pseudoduganella umbonata]|uniref:Uncharacterized protein n=1 Tax=Pseudoduganella umbonata TaxID=864828 RepID=A0A4P8HYB7_9BURK|nr:hypothetical protein [Pseudoduganella umbonata]MBB3224158.1 hypothetical protein [Pseudoduganella umbonata]QCP13982.1 hypothetical protein FCL38_28865 [Pseudoduganella umbonata]